jgi:hypothetical protein
VNWEVYALQFACDGYFNPGCVLTQELNNLPLVGREFVLLIQMGALRNVFSKTLEQVVDFKSFFDAATEVVLVDP